MAQAPTQDFIVKSGLNVQGTSTVTSSTGNTSTLQVDGGAAIAKNLIVGEDTVIYGDLEVYGSIPSLTITTGTFTDLTVSNLSSLNAVIDIIQTPCLNYLWQHYKLDIPRWYYLFQQTLLCYQRRRCHLHQRRRVLVEHQ